MDEYNIEGNNISQLPVRNILSYPSFLLSASDINTSVMYTCQQNMFDVVRYNIIKKYIYFLSSHSYITALVVYFYALLCTCYLSTWKTS